jgi:outer membrane protein, multidrug efflux system
VPQRTLAALALAFPAETLRQRPDVRTAEHRVSAALARVDAGRRGALPELSARRLAGPVCAHAGHAGNGASVQLAAGQRVGAAVRRRRGQAQVRAQEAALEQAPLAYQATVLTALKDVEDALVSLQGNRERLARLQAAASDSPRQTPSCWPASAMRAA